MERDKGIEPENHRISLIESVALTPIDRSENILEDPDFGLYN
jgi:hypothetical protein